MDESTNQVVEISKIKLKIGEKEIELSLSECERLHAVLNELFKVKVEKEHVNTLNPLAPYYPAQPIWVIPPQNDWPWWKQYEITCTSVSHADSSNVLNINCN